MNLYLWRTITQFKNKMLLIGTTPATVREEEWKYKIF